MRIKTKETALMPVDGAKSFYNKAYVEQAEDGALYLRSYDTIIMKVVDGKAVERYWDAEKGYQNTTLRHIRAFMKMFKVDMFKKEFMELPRTYLAVEMELPAHKNNAGDYWPERFWRM